MITIPAPVLKPNTIYSGDNGMLICLQCAGMTAKYTGRDLSGQKVEAVPIKETIEWKKMFGTDLTCESGCTSYPQPKSH